MGRFGVLGVLAIAQLAYITRMLWYASLTAETVWYVLPCEVLHGLTFAALWSACCNYAAAVAPPGLKASVQGVVGGVHWGLGVGTGATVGGLSFGLVGGVRTFELGSLVPMLGFAVAFCACRRYPNRTRSPAQDAQPKGEDHEGAEERRELLHEGGE